MHWLSPRPTCLKGTTALQSSRAIPKILCDLADWQFLKCYFKSPKKGNFKAQAVGGRPSRDADSRTVQSAIVVAEAGKGHPPGKGRSSGWGLLHPGKPLEETCAAPHSTGQIQNTATVSSAKAQLLFLMF